MTVILNRYLLIFSLFSQSVTGEPVCAYPYSCVPTSVCAERHAVRGTEEVLFQCGDKNKVCCPAAPRSKEEEEANNCETTDYTNGKDCNRTPVRPSFEQSSSYPGGTGTIANLGTAVSGNFNNPQGEARPYPSQPPESRRPVQQPQGQSNHPQTQPVFAKPHVHVVVQKPQNSQRTPQDSSATDRPQKTQISPIKVQSQRPQSASVSTQSQQPQSSSGSFHSQEPDNPQSQRPLNPVVALQTSRPQGSSSSSPLAFHRNFRLLPSEAQCGVHSFANRITEGEEVSLGEYPWMALTGIKDKYGNYRWNCGGTLINGWYVLTAAHCLVVDNRTIEFVRLGEHSLTNETDCSKDVCLEPPEDVLIAEVIPHERWNTTTIKNDIALLRLSRNPLKLGKSNINPICLPLEIDKLNVSSSTKYAVAGWGKTDWNADEGSDVLRKASLSGVTLEECNICKDKKKQQYCPITDTQLCVQGWKSVDVCKGDSGGPLMVVRLNVYQVGVTSFKGSEYCGAENIPSIFTRVESYLPWILDNIRE